LGHASTFCIAARRAVAANGALILRSEDLDVARCKSEYSEAMLEDLRWLGLSWSEGPDVGGPFGPYRQSERASYYLDIWKQLHATGNIYPSPHSRRDVQHALQAPHDDDEDAEPLFPVELRPPLGTGAELTAPGAMNWRFRVPDGEEIEFVDGRFGKVARVAGRDFGDFVVWRKYGIAAYELAVVADDRAMRITEVVRGADLLTSTARQLLLHRALNWQPPAYYHCDLVRDEHGRRLAKRTHALALRTLREQGKTRDDVLALAGL
jgi:glutamyl-tRNA synthetase